MAWPFYFFGRQPSDVIFQSSTDFDGTVMTGTPVLSSGQAAYPKQAAGGLFKFHSDNIEVKTVTYTGGGTATLYKNQYASDGSTVISMPIDVLSASGIYKETIFLSPSQWLTVVTAAASNPTVIFTSYLSNYSYDGG